MYRSALPVNAGTRAGDPAACQQLPLRGTANAQRRPPDMIHTIAVVPLVASLLHRRHVSWGGRKLRGRDRPQPAVTGGVPWVWNDSIVFSPQAWPFLRSSSLQTIGFQSGARISRAPALATSTRLPPGSQT
jgi:hypothetical protein